MNDINWSKATKDDLLAISKACDRVGEKYPDIDRMTLNMDLVAVHVGDCPMDFGKLLKADDFNFFHDVFGIMNHIDRNTGKLRDCFLPRCSA